MPHLNRIAQGIDVAPVLAEIGAHDELWDAHPLRRDYANSPHCEMSDIWVRARRNTGGHLTDYSEPHYSEWWPAFKLLPSLRPIIFGLMARVSAAHLGGVLITRVGPGKRIYPHNDTGHWHADFHNCKVYVCLQGNADCVVWCAHERAIMKAGEAWRFENRVMHGLENEGETDRISLIIAMRVE